ncbi:MAG: hypothetical protein K2N51_19325 [Lachnospiraceae bacterium]|nr:hypothetical protein [Lachnospiraceae bacterium]
MKLEDYQEIYKKMEMPKKMDERIREGIMEKENGKRKEVNKKTLVQTACAVAAAIMVVGVLQAPSIATASRQLAEQFTNKFTAYTEDGEDVDIEMKGEYLKINANAKKTNCKMDSLKTAEKELGLPLLKSKDAYEEKNCIAYNALLSESGELYQVELIDDFYVLGDIKDVNTEMFSQPDDVNDIRFHEGKEYRSPICMEIVVRLNSNEDVEHPEYDGVTADFSEDKDVNVYEIKNLGVKAVLSTVETAGVWWDYDLNTVMRSCAYAVFVYKGIEYRYMGAVSQDTMKTFLEGLAE